MSNRHRIGWLSLIVILAMMLASCGGAATSPPAEPTTVPVEPTEAPPEPTEAPPEPTQTEEPGVIKIGLPAGFTGPVPIPSSSMGYAAEIAVEEINAIGGVEVGGKKYLLELVKADTKCNPEEAVAALERLITVDEVDFIVGGLCSSGVTASMHVAQRDRIPYLVTCASSTQIDQMIAEESLKYLFHFSPTQIDVIGNAAKAVIELFKPTTFAILAEDTDAGQDADEYFRQYAAEHAPDLEILSTDFVPQDAGDMLLELSKVKSEDPDVLFVFFTGVNNETFVQQYQELGLQTLLVAAGTEFARSDFVQAHPEVTNYTLVNIRWSPAFKTELTNAFLDKYEPIAGREADFFALQQYDAIYVLVDALERAGTLDPDAVVMALEGTELTGVWGTHTFTSLSEGHRGSWDMVIAQVQNATHVVVFPIEAAEGPVLLPDWYKPGE